MNKILSTFVWAQDLGVWQGNFSRKKNHEHHVYYLRVLLGCAGPSGVRDLGLRAPDALFLRAKYVHRKGLDPR